MNTKRKRISEEFVKHCIVEWLTRNKFGRNLKYTFPEGKGVDIRVKHSTAGFYYFIETKGEYKSRSVEEGSVMSAIAQIHNRIKVKTARYKYGIGLPESSVPMIMRKLSRQDAMRNRIYVLSVNDKREVKEYTPRDIGRYKENQNK